MIVVGWHEPVVLPELGVERAYAKIDTAADHSTLHAVAIVAVGADEVEFSAPMLRYQKSCSHWLRGGVRRVRAPVVDERIIRSSNGTDDVRFVIETRISLGGVTFETHLSLTNRDGLRFPMLIGRSALAGRFLVDAGKSHLTEEQEDGCPKESELGAPGSNRAVGSGAQNS